MSIESGAGITDIIGEGFFEIPGDWQVNFGCLSKRGRYILKKGLLSDCRFIVGNPPDEKVFNLHKLMLSMASPIFEKMFLNNFHESNNDILVPDIHPEAFKAMCSYIYTDVLDITSFGLAVDVYYIADKYIMPLLANHCKSFIEEKLDDTNACRAYEFADLFRLDKLKKQSLKIIQENTAHVASLRNFREIQLSTLKFILKTAPLNISESRLFKAVAKWTFAEFKRRGIDGDEHLDKQRALCAELNPYIHYIDMRPDKFAEGPARSSFFTIEQAFAVLMNLTSPTCGYPWPKELPKSSRKKFRY